MTYSLSRVLRACCLLMPLLATGAHAQDSASPLTLRQAIDAALSGNPELAVFAFEFRAEDARTQQASLRPAPELSTDIENILGSGEASGTNSAEFTLALSQVIELGGKRDARVSVAQARRSAIEVDRQIRQLDVLAEVTRRYIAVGSLQEHVRLAGIGRALAQKTIAGAEKRVNAAKSPHVELDRAHIALDRARLVEQRTAAQLEAARKQLAATWGESTPIIDGRPFGEVVADLYKLQSVDDFQELLARLDANTDFLRFASEARVRDAELRLATTLRKPDVTLGGGMRRLEATQDQAFVASISMPLFSGRRATSVIAESRAVRERVDVDRQIAAIKAKTTLYELHSELGLAVLEARTLMNDTLPRSREALTETEYAYERGRYSYLELVDAQREYLSVESELIDAATAAHLMRAEIERLTNAPLAREPS